MSIKCVSGRITTTLCMSVLFSLLSCQDADTKLVLEDTFDDPSLDHNKWGVSFWPLDNGIDPEIVNSPTRAGAGAVKQIVQYMWNGEQDANRCEIQGYRQKDPRIGQHIGYFQRFDETWIGFSVYLPSNSWIPDNISRELVFQTHGSADDGEPSRSPPLSLKIDLGTTEWYWQVRWDSSRISNSAQPTGSGAGVVDVWKDIIEKDTWTDWVIHAIWDYAADGVGLLEIWRNGEQVATRHGPNIYNDAKGMRGPIFGIYKWGWRDGPSDVTERIIYHDEFRNGDETASYDDVDPAQRDKAK
ncbi:polysaccharide lyase [Candidatus Neomarinimicrobiota bacterium]